MAKFSIKLFKVLLWIQFVAVAIGGAVAGFTFASMLDMPSAVGLILGLIAGVIVAFFWVAFGFIFLSIPENLFAIRKKLEESPAAPAHAPTYAAPAQRPAPAPAPAKNTSYTIPDIPRPSAPPAAESAAASCPSCGAPVTPGVAFCTKCGQKVG